MKNYKINKTDFKNSKYKYLNNVMKLKFKTGKHIKIN